MLWEAEVRGVKTHISVAHHANRIFLIISQDGNIGTLVHAQKDNPVEHGQTGTFSAKVLLGRRDADIVEVYARTLIELVSKRLDVPLLLGISLKDESPEMFRAILKHMDELGVLYPK